jgi:hypothetical protein
MSWTHTLQHCQGELSILPVLSTVVASEAEDCGCARGPLISPLPQLRVLDGPFPERKVVEVASCLVLDQIRFG